MQSNSISTHQSKDLLLAIDWINHYTPSDSNIIINKNLRGWMELELKDRHFQFYDGNMTVLRQQKNNYLIKMNDDIFFNNNNTKLQNVYRNDNFFMAAIPAAVRHLRQKKINTRIFFVMAITGAVGAFCGSLLTTYVPVALLLSFIGIIVSYESVVLIRGKSKIRNESNTKNESMSKNKILLIESIIGFAICFVGGLVGLVLGSIRLPTMISVLKMKPSVAIGTNLATSSVMGISGLIGHLVNNEVDFLILIVMGFVAMIGGYIGASFTHRFSKRNLKRIIGIVLIVVAITMFIRVATII
jgi:uncharacterized membrane protein YfcA